MFLQLIRTVLVTILVVCLIFSSFVMPDNQTVLTATFLINGLALLPFAISRTKSEKEDDTQLLAKDGASLVLLMFLLAEGLALGTLF